VLYILWGEDLFSIQEKLQEIKDGLGDLSFLATNTSVLDGQKLSVNELRSKAETMPFLSEKRLVIVNGLLDRFEAKDKPVKAKKASTVTKEDESKLFADCLNNLPPTTVLVLTDNIEMKKNALVNNPLFKAISGKAEVKPFPGLKGIKLSQWIQAKVTLKSGAISEQATALLMQLIGGDLYTLNNEINKLLAFTASRRIEEKDVRMVVSAAQEADVFSMVDAIIDKKAGLAESLLGNLTQKGVAPTQILVLLARQIQLMVQIKDLKSQKKSSADIQTRLGIVYGFIWDKISARAEKYSADKLKDIYRKLLETDLAIKTGKYEGDLALEILIADLCEN
jgi:DNA polymerase-3 subunit delta